MDEFLFLAKGKLKDHLVELTQQAEQLVDEIREDELIAMPPETDISVLFPDLLPKVPALLLNDVTPKRELSPKVGSVIRFYVPFRGEASLFCYTPTQHTAMPPRGAVADVLVVTIPMAVRDAQAIEDEFRENIREIQQWLGFVRQDLSTIEATLPLELRARMGRRRERIIRERAVADELVRRYERYRTRTNPKPG